MIKAALIGAGKMGISHLSILGAHPDVEIVGVCDTSKMVTDVLEKYSGFSCFSDFSILLSEETNPGSLTGLRRKISAASPMTLVARSTPSSRALRLSLVGERRIGDSPGFGGFLSV